MRYEKATTGEEWAAVNRSLHVPLSVVSVAPGFHAEMRRWDLDEGIGLVDGTAGATRLRRSRRDIAAAGDDHYLFQIQLHGSTRVRQAERTCEITPGAAVLYTTDSLAEFDFLAGTAA